MSGPLDHLKPEHWTVIEQAQRAIGDLCARGIDHRVVRHHQPAVLLDPRLCDEEIIVLCGAAVFAKVKAINDECIAMNVDALTTHTIAKASGA